MSSQYEIQLSGPFEVTDSLGRIGQIESIRIFNGGYSIIDVYIVLAWADEDGQPYEDPVVIRQVLARLRLLGYKRPNFEPDAKDLQDSHLIALEAPEDLQIFAAAKGWKNLAENYIDDAAREKVTTQDRNAAQAIYSALMRKMRRDQNI